MSLNDELKKEAETAKEKVDELLSKLESFEQIKTNLSSSDNGIKKALDDLNLLIASVNTIAKTLDAAAMSIKETSEKLSSFSELSKKIDQIEKNIKSSNKDLTEKIKKSTLLGRFSIK